jgi:arabinan endo-1,5-alpha-L-arabinosidase
MRGHLLFRILLIPVLSLLACPPASAQRGDIAPVHDPALIVAGGRYYLFCTGRGIPVRQSDDLFTWRTAGRVFDKPALPAWAAAAIPGARGIWAPDVQKVGDEYRLYYAVSTLGSRRSVIGLATNATLDPSRPQYAWRDRGMVIDTTEADDHNAIDPNLVLDERGQHWLVFGSYWSGIKARRIDPATGLLSKQDPRLYDLARRPKAADGAVEGAVVIRRGEFYYLFVSFDVGVRGLASTYNVRVGRSRHVTGPYRDRAGRDMLAGGGTLLLCSYANVRGPGHIGIAQTDHGDFFANHFYDVDDPPRPKLQIRPILWQPDAWPLVGEPIAGPVTSATTRPAATFDPAGPWMHQVAFNPPSRITLAPDGQVHGLRRDSTWRFDAGALTLNADDAVEHCIVDPTGDAFIGRTHTGALVRAWRAKP